MLNTIILVGAIIFQTAAVVIALRLIPITGKRFSWIMIAIALVLMDVRRIVPIFITSLQDPALASGLALANDIVGLLLSIFMAIGIFSVAPIFLGIKRANDELKKDKLFIESILNTTINGVLAVDAEGKVILYNKQFAEMWQIPQEVLNTQDGNKYSAYSLKNLKQPEKFLTELRVLYANRDKKSRDEVEFKDGRVLDRYSAPLQDVNAVYYGRVWFFHDISMQKKLEADLRQGKLFNESIVNTTLDGVLAVDEEGKVILYNKQFAEMWQIPKEILNTQDGNKYSAYSLKNLTHPDKFLAELRVLYANRDKKSRDEVEFKDGKIFDRYSSPLQDINGVCYGRVWFFRDITEQKKVEAEIQNRLIFEGIVGQIAKRLSELDFFEIDKGIEDSLGVIGQLLGVDRANIFMFADDNKTMECRYKWQTKEALLRGEQVLKLPQESFQLLNTVLTNSENLQVRDVHELTDAWAQEKKIWEKEHIQSIICIPLYIQHKYIGFICLDSIHKKISWGGEESSFLKTIGEIIAGLIRKKAGEQLERLAQFDPLTGLANRYTFNLIINKSIAHAARRKLKFSILSVDLDNFKKVNDTYGHDIGDLLLQEVGNRLAKSIRAEDLIARVGGDEFFVILNEIVDCDEACEVAQRIIDGFKQEFKLNGISLVTSTSIGIACFPCGGEDKETLLKNVDIALYKAKNAGKNRYSLFSSCD